MAPRNTLTDVLATEDAWHALVAHAPTGLACLDLGGRILSLNPFGCELLGFARDELIGRAFVDLVHPDERGEHRRAQTALASGQLAVHHHDQRVLKKDGSVLCLELRFVLVRDEAGAPKYVIGTLHDVTRRKQAEHALRESERRFRTLFEQAPFSVQLLGKDGRTLKVNEAWIDLWGFPRDVVENFILKEYLILKDPQLEELGIGPLLREAYAGESVLIPPAQYDPARLDKEGRARWVIGNAHPIKDEQGAVVEVVLFHYDVTDRIEAEVELKRAKDEAEAASRMKSTFLATMSHEFRTPLNAIMGFTQVLKNDTIQASERQRVLEIIERSGRTLARIVDDVLDLSKIEAGVLRVEKALVRPRDIIQEVVTLLGGEAEKKALALSCEFVTDEPEWLETDPFRLRQILINLVGNALKFTAKGSVTVRLTTSPDRGELVVSICDTGIGIPAEQRQRLFKLFSRAEDPDVQARAGTGLGLALSQKLAKALGGDVILLESTPGVGSTFALVLPISEM